MKIAVVVALLIGTIIFYVYRVFLYTKKYLQTRNLYQFDCRMLPEDDGYSSTFIVILQMGWLRPILMKFRGNCFSKESITESRLKEILSLTEINTFNNSFKKSLGGIVYDYDLGNIKYTITFYPERD